MVKHGTFEPHPRIIHVLLLQEAKNLRQKYPRDVQI